MQIKPLLPFVLKPGNQIKNENLNWIVYCFDDLQASDLFQLIFGQKVLSEINI
jgi:hypothetical protein